MKYIIAIPDGAADNVEDFNNGNTPMRVAETPFMDSLANAGEVGWAANVPPSCHPGSDVACLSIFGYNPDDVYTGRAPLEAASIQINLDNKVAFRCNLVTVQDGIMKDFTAGHISTEEASEIIQSLNDNNKDESIQYYTGVQYRHIMTAALETNEVQCTPPHDILDQGITSYLPQGRAAEQVQDLMKQSQELLASHPVNQKRLRENKRPVTQTWLWGQGTAPALDTLQSRFGLTGSVVSAVDLIKGIGVLAGLDVIEVRGATGLPNTNYEGKAEAALQALETQDFALIHVEAPDEMGHQGDEKMKIQSIHDFDQRLIKLLVETLRNRNEDFRIAILPDHPTPISLRTHTKTPVPFLLYDSTQHNENGTQGFSEVGVQSRSEKIIEGYTLMQKLVMK